MSKKISKKKKLKGRERHGKGKNKYEKFSKLEEEVLKRK